MQRDEQCPTLVHSKMKDEVEASELPSLGDSWYPNKMQYF